MTQFVKFDKLKQVLQGLLDISTKKVLVGIPDGTTGRTDEDQGPMNNATLGYIHENGSPAANIPARPFLIQGIEDAQEEIASRLKKASQAALDRKPDKVKQQLEAAGTVAEMSVKNKINSGDFDPLSEATLRARARRGRKGAIAELASRAAGNAPNADNARPLIDTGQLRNSITHVIRG